VFAAQYRRNRQVIFAGLFVARFRLQNNEFGSLASALRPGDSGRFSVIGGE